jgi:hypothetical protein
MPTKIPNGLSRAVIAAKQINAANLDIVAVQEIDRSPGGVSHNYIYRLAIGIGGLAGSSIEPTCGMERELHLCEGGVASHATP